jgi:hypothetical protein
MIRNVARDLKMGVTREVLMGITRQLNDVLVEIRYVDDLPPMTWKQLPTSHTTAPGTWKCGSSAAGK